MSHGLGGEGGPQTHFEHRAQNTPAENCCYLSFSLLLGGSVVGRHFCLTWQLLRGVQSTGESSSVIGGVRSNTAFSCFCSVQYLDDLLRNLYLFLFMFLQRQIVGLLDWTVLPFLFFCVFFFMIIIIILIPENVWGGTKYISTNSTNLKLSQTISE